ncbi:MAG: hypothetical protein Q8R18_03055 [bacterium]|nr:hypothetical protein [bacterium]
MYKVQRVTPGNLNALLQIADDNAFKIREIQDQVFRKKGMHYIVGNKEEIIGSAYWIQDPEREYWIRLKEIRINAKPENEERILEGLITASEHSFRMAYQNSFNREGINARVLGAVFEIKDPSIKRIATYRRLGYTLIDDDPIEIWQKDFPREKIDAMPQTNRYRS